MTVSQPSPSRPLLRSVRSLLALLVLVLWSPFAEPATSGAVTVEQIPSPRPAGWTVDLTGTLPAPMQAEIDRIAGAVREQGRGELAVVVIGSTGGAPHRDFATRLANAWGVGSAERDDGVLILAALDDRAVEIVLGLGLDSPAEVQASQEIVDGEMIPRFRGGDPAGAVRAGAEAVARRLFDATLPADLVGTEVAAPQPAPAEAPPGWVAPEAAPDVSGQAAPDGLLSAVEALPPAASSSSSFLSGLPVLLVIGLPVLLILRAVAFAVGRTSTPRSTPRLQRPDDDDGRSSAFTASSWGASSSSSSDASSSSSSGSGFSGGSSGGSGGSGTW